MLDRTGGLWDGVMSFFNLGVLALKSNKLGFRKRNENILDTVPSREAYEEFF